ncbi:unnamed protein product [Protopolystoma xenopodis]|uniref:Uncharacterized protein n=1 Tax=Protopolystoma xenopodis TaxID=117903 RepID=A0A3S5APL0_9PLAT|nr:unnamed protein product [Protopolystoma xenopodis]
MLLQMKTIHNRVKEPLEEEEFLLAAALRINIILVIIRVRHAAMRPAPVARQELSAKSFASARPTARIG